MKALWFAVILLIAVGTGWAADDQAYLGIFAETRAQLMAGMPAMPAMPAGMDMSMIPGMAAMRGFGAPTRNLEVRLWSPGIAPVGATAYLDIPDGLKLGKRLNLELYRPKAGQTEPEMPGGATPPDMTIKIYWGSSATVRPGQPRVIRIGDLAASARAEMQRQAQNLRGSYFYKPDWTTAYWPTQRQPGTIAADASLVGHYALTSSYTGAVALDDPATVNFLAPFELTSPDLSGTLAFDRALELAWKTVPNLLGQNAQIIGMEGRNTIIIWSSSENEAGATIGDAGFLEMAQVRQMVTAQTFMAPARTSATVPAGIFQNADMANLTLAGWGPGTALAAGQPLPRIQTKTVLTVMLGGKGITGMGGYGQ